MNCFTHPATAAVGMCCVCQRGVCRDCVAAATPRVVCRTCAAAGPGMPSGWYGGYGWGFEYASSQRIGDWPIVHVCSGVDPITMRPRVAKGVIAIGNIAVGVLAIGGIACGLVTLGGVSLGLLFALGGLAIGVGLSMGGVAVGSIAVGGVAAGLVYAIGGAAFGPAILDARRCDQAARVFLQRWFGTVPVNCR